MLNPENLRLCQAIVLASFEMSLVAHHIGGLHDQGSKLDVKFVLSLQYQRGRPR